MAQRGEIIYKRKDGRWEGRCIIGHDENDRAFFGISTGAAIRK